MSAILDAESPLARAKSMVTVADVWRALGVAGEPPRPGSGKARVPWREDRNPSFGITPDGMRWWDWGRDEGGDVVDFIARYLNVSNSDAAKQLIAIAGTVTTPPITNARQAHRPDPSGRELPLSMRPEVARIWSEGVSFLLADARTQAEIAEWRGWPTWLVAMLADDGLLGMPLHGGERRVAWRVDRPDAERGGYGPRAIGYHVRIPPIVEGERASWRFAPGDGSIKPLPVVWGDFPNARLLIITEGQWDAATFGLVAGWFASEGCWPEDIALTGIRGAQGTGAFLEHYRRHWPADPPVCVLLRDNDPAGAGWLNDGAFAHQLRRRCRRVIPTHMRGSAKDLNESHSRDPVMPAMVAAMLLEKGITDTRGRHI